MYVHICMYFDDNIKDTFDNNRSSIKIIYVFYKTHRIRQTFSWIGLINQYEDE